MAYLCRNTPVRQDDSTRKPRPDEKRMLITVSQLRERVSTDLASLIDELQSATGRYVTDEANAWRESLPRLGSLLWAPSMLPLHLCCAGPAARGRDAQAAARRRRGRSAFAISSGASPSLNNDRTSKSSETLESAASILAMRD